MSMSIPRRDQTSDSDPGSNPGAGDEPSFEKSLEELESIVAQLEGGAKPLDESLMLYERGIAAYRRCNVILEKAKARIRAVVAGANGEPVFREIEVPKSPDDNQNRKKSRRDLPAAKFIAPPSSSSPKPGPESAPPAPPSPAACEKNEENFDHQPIDSGESSPQNPSDSSLTRSRTNQGKPRSGDTLFGNTQ